MRTFLLILTALPVLAESHPTWWGLAPSGSTGIVGIAWQNLKSSPFADAVSEELSSSVGLPALPAIADARQILIAAPPILAMITGSFDSVALRAQATKLAMKPSVYQGVSLWISSDPSVLSIALLNDQLLLAGSRNALQAAIDRSQAERRHYCPLLARAARYAEADLWVVADKLPDPLASIFVPIDVPADSGGFEGYATVHNGLTVEASLDAGSEENAAAVAANLRESASSLPPVAQGLEARLEGRTVFFSLAVDAADLAAGLRSAPIQPPPQPVAPVPAPKPAAEPAGPQVIKIFGLEDGPREIVMPKSQKPDK